jgi:hypothetical protein
MLEEVLHLNAESTRYLAEGPDRRLAVSVLERVDGLRGDAGVSHSTGITVVQGSR